MTDTLRTWDTYFCAECCNGDRCDDPTHYDRQKCPHCKGTGLAIWKMRDLMRELSALRQANAEPVAEVLYAGILDAQQRHLQFIVVKEQLPDHMKLYAVPIAKTAAQPAPACGCKRADAWKCAVEQRLSSVSCHCACHKQPAPAAAICPGCGQLNDHDMYLCVQNQIAAARVGSHIPIATVSADSVAAATHHTEDKLDMVSAPAAPADVELAALTWLFANIAWGNEDTTAYSIHKLVAGRRKELLAATQEKSK